MWLVCVVIRRYIDILIIIINFPYSTCIRSFLGSYMVWGVRIRHVVLVQGLGCYYMGYGVRIQNGVLVYMMGCWNTGWGVSIQDWVLVYGMGC